MKQSPPSTTQDREQSANFPHMSIRGLSVSLALIPLTAILCHPNNTVPSKEKGGAEKMPSPSWTSVPGPFRSRDQRGVSTYVPSSIPAPHLLGKTCDSGRWSTVGKNQIRKALLERTTTLSPHFVCDWNSRWLSKKLLKKKKKKKPGKRQNLCKGNRLTVTTGHLPETG